MIGIETTPRISPGVHPNGRVLLRSQPSPAVQPADRPPTSQSDGRSPAAPRGFGANVIGRDRAAQHVPEVLEGQGCRPGQQRLGVQAGAADTCEVERAEDDGTGGESSDVRCEVAAALNAGG